MASFDRRLGRHVKYAEKLPKKAIEPLRKLYEEIDQKGHAITISKWLDAQNDNENSPADTTWSITGLMVLFEQLGELNIVPFNDGKVRLITFEEERDWTKLPALLQYLVEPAEKYGKIQFEIQIFEFLDNRMTPEEKLELQALSVRWKQDCKSINKWLDEFNITNNPEARLVYFTGLLIGLALDSGRL